ncbi:MAG TPA: GDSL-type esterase/lipase family protein [Alphaproteobacteria bacterium]
MFSLARRLAPLVLVVMLGAMPHEGAAQQPQKWVASWAGSVQGPYPIGNASAQPELRFAFPVPGTGAKDQTFRLIVRPDIWGHQTRLRLSNVFGTKPVTFDGVFVGEQLSGAAVMKGTNRPVTFAGKPTVTILPGEWAWSDAVALDFVRNGTAEGRKLAVSFHVVGDSGPMTWHAKSLTTSYVTPPGAGSKGQIEDESAFPFSTVSWYFLDAVDMMAPADTRVVVAFGDSITDGTASTINGDDRWPDVLSRRLHARYGSRFSVVNAGIGGNQIAGPAEYSPHNAYAGGPSAGARLERDVLGLSGVSYVIWLEGINDFSRNGNASLETVQTRMTEIVGRLRAKLPGVHVIGATVTTALGSSSSAHGFAEQDAKRKALNQFIRSSGVFDGVADFDRVTVDPETGGLRAEFVPESSTGGHGDKLHPNRAGYLAMGQAIDLDLFMPKAAAPRSVSR